MNDRKEQVIQKGRTEKVVVTVECEDICDPEPFCCILGVTSNEPINGPEDDTTEPDWESSDDEPLVALLRAERAGGGTRRIYTIIVKCMVASGNTATAMVEVTVPKRKQQSLSGLLQFYNEKM